MLILALRTDTDEAQIYLYQDNQRLAFKRWPAGRQLSKQLLEAIIRLLSANDSALANLEGLVLFSGPGSFTGLRIGAAVANALAYAQQIPIASGSGRDWLKDGISKLLAGGGETQILPQYDREPNATLPK